MIQTGKAFLRVIKQPNFALIALVVINLVIGLFTFQDYGTSWDEPLYYGYADALGYAYSIQPRLNGTFDITNSYGPSGDHAMYGPAYLLLGRNFVYLFEKITSLDRVVLWHAMNFVFFQVGLIFLYLLCRRWMSAWAAFAATLMYSSQPLIWGHAFINPKDLPFTTFFIAAIYTGLRFVDQIKGEPETLPEPDQAESARWRSRRKRWLRLGLICGVAALLLLVLDPLLQDWIRKIMAAIYAADPTSLAGRMFRAVAEDAGKVEVGYYAGRLIHLYQILRSAAMAILLLLVGVAVGWWALPKQSQAFWRETGASLRRIILWQRGVSFWSVLKKALLPGVILGLVTSVRVLGPLAGLLAAIYFLLEKGRRPIGPGLVYAGIALLTSYLTWPFLWSDPVGNFILVLRHMSNNPTSVGVLFGGIEYSSLDLPASYLPTLLGITLSEPVWPLMLAGLVIAGIRIAQKKMEWRDFGMILVWFGLPCLYVVLTRPPMYDGYRHFLFILPPVFILIGLAFQAIGEWIRRPWFRWLLLALCALPGILGILSIHPYEYAFYNSYVGGPAGAFRRYDADYWLTCYKDALEPINQKAEDAPRVIVPLQAALAQKSASEGVTVLKYDSQKYAPQSGDYFLLTTRFGRDRQDWPATEEDWTVGRHGALYCVVKQVP